MEFTSVTAEVNENIKFTKLGQFEPANMLPMAESATAVTTTDEMRWNPDDLLRAEDAPGLIAQIEQSLPKFKKHLDDMRPDMGVDELCAYFDFENGVRKAHARLARGSFLRTQVDKDDQSAGELMQRAAALNIGIEAAIQPINHWLMGKDIDRKAVLDDTQAARFSAVPGLEYALQRLRRSAPHTLGVPEERIIQVKDGHLGAAIPRIRGVLTSGFRFTQTWNGEPREIAESDIRAQFSSPNPEVREGAYRVHLEKYAKKQLLLFNMYQAVASDLVSTAELRGYPSPIAMWNHRNDIPDAVTENLLAACLRNTDIFQRYFRWKAEYLGMRKLRRYDVSAPLNGVQYRIPFAQGKELAREIYGTFSPDFGQQVQTLFTSRHVDSHPRDRKQSPGQYCAQMPPGVLPFVFLNYVDDVNSAFTLFHELGHAVHCMHIDNPYMRAREPSSALSEVASTFGEALSVGGLLAGAKTRGERVAVLDAQMSRLCAVVMRQAFFTIFEQRALAALSRGTTPDTLSDIYFATLEEQFGDSVELDPSFRNEWATVPHFPTYPLYCTAYPLANLVALGAHDQYQREGESFVPRYRELLRTSSSGAPRDVLRKLGHDIMAPNFFDGCFGVIRNLQQRLEEL